MTDQPKQDATQADNSHVNQSTKESAVTTGQETQTGKALQGKRAYIKPTLRKFSQIDYVTAYGVD